MQAASCRAWDNAFSGDISHRVPYYDVAVLGVPFDNGTSYRPDARFGPMTVRRASRHLRPGHHVELGCSPFSAIQVVDAGDVPVTPFSIDAATQQIAGHAEELLHGSRKVIAVGGDHTVALPMLRTVVRERVPGPPEAQALYLCRARAQSAATCHYLPVTRRGRSSRR